jgi:hypothetical protein
LFYKNLADNKTQNNNGIPNINEIKEFWSNIWSNEIQFNNQAEWIPNLENEIPDSNNPHHIQISLKILVKNIFCSTLSEFENFLLCERILINVTTCQNETSS